MDKRDRLSRGEIAILLVAGALGVGVLALLIYIAIPLAFSLL